MKVIEQSADARRIAAAQSYIETEQRYGAHNYDPLDIVVERAQGVWLYDVEGRKYLDCISAYSAVNQGHRHPRIESALIAQAKRATLVSRAMRNDRMPAFLQRLTEACGYEMALPTNTGVEAVETAIKLVRRWGYEVKGIPENAAEIVVFNDNFHGRTTSVISASSTPEYKRHFGPFMPGFVLATFGDLDALARALNDNTAAILIEPIQGEGGVNVPPDGYLHRAWELCKERRVLFIADEIQTGFGRTGDLFAQDHENVKADVLLVGKALGGGYYPVSAALASAELMNLFAPGDHGSTFGGNPLASAVAQAALDVVLEENLAENARKMGHILMAGLREIRSPLIKEVRGRGLLVGVEFRDRARPIADAMLKRGIACKDTQENVLRFAPPLVIQRAEIELILDTFGDVIRSF
ncbi:MAG: ornithine--oxo-acid transaminase [Candidatus Meridianibacter frigidus]|nr:MAG: ornithine--oxo-acid transaminase [Candidatus Eremiobacteraeota bacterium]